MKSRERCATEKSEQGGPRVRRVGSNRDHANDLTGARDADPIEGAAVLLGNRAMLGLARKAASARAPAPPPADGAGDGGPPAPGAKSGGVPLEPAARARYEEVLDADLSEVRIHDDRA